MSWELNREHHWRSDAIRLKEYLLWDIIRTLKSPEVKVEGEVFKVRLSAEEKLFLMAAENLRDSYRRKDQHVKRNLKVNAVIEESQQLAQQLLEVTEERDTLLDKIKEAQVASGLFIQSVRKKLGLEDKNV